MNDMKIKFLISKHRKYSYDLGVAVYSLRRVQEVLTKEANKN